MKKNISKKTLKEFGLLIGICFPVLIGWALPVLFAHSFRIWTIWISIPSLVFAIARPRWLYYPYLAWMKLGDMMGWLNSRLILGLVFLLVLLPLALIMRIFGHDPLKVKKTDQKSYREIKTNHKINLKKIF